MKLNKKTIIEAKLPATFSIPGKSLFELPEKVLQFMNYGKTFLQRQSKQGSVVY